MPDEIGFATKPQIAITQLREARQSGAPDGVVLAVACRTLEGQGWPRGEDGAAFSESTRRT
ncbi:hypothetical protein AYM40_05785 [Paraburkholderia phytofirmans OLGA172]|uniref:Uncharacterized protein n=1 Tax=Paraburkholderia phytofirmans OLGA172 TaxID=1417228 RepID=A0A160FJ50_9BURK|nr:hypothetical protein AYM40_05785 [Paraburkholderia phytofirmans OLGA172]